VFINVSVHLEGNSGAQAVIDEPQTRDIVNHERDREKEDDSPIALDVPTLPHTQLPPSPLLGAGNIQQFNMRSQSDRSQCSLTHELLLMIQNIVELVEIRGAGSKLKVEGHVPLLDMWLQRLCSIDAVLCRVEGYTFIN